MKIAIYGDSFACINTKWDSGKMDKAHLGISWVEILENAGHEITNFAESGSAFMFSYENLLKEHRNHDLNIFVVTDPQRTYIKALDGIKLFGFTWAESEYERVKKLPFYPRKVVHLEILKSARAYLEHWADWEMMTHVQQVLVTNLWNIAPNTIVIPAFSDSIEQTNTNLFDTAKYELELVNSKEFEKFDFGYLDCQRKCHFSNENNIVLGNKLLDAINNNQTIVTFAISECVRPAGNDFYFYVRSNKKG